MLSANRESGGKIAWYESDGGSPPTFVEHPIALAVPEAFSVSVADLDADGHLDVLATILGNDTVAWYQNDGGLPPTFSEVVAEPAEEVILFTGTGEGTSFVPFGPCAGTKLDLAFGRQWHSVTTDGDGEVSFTRTAFSAWCGRYLQALDRSCSTSNYALQIQDDGHMVFSIYWSSAAGDRTLLETSPGLVVPNQWQHWAATYDQERMRIYLDGVLVIQQAEDSSASLH